MLKNLMSKEHFEALMEQEFMFNRINNWHHKAKLRGARNKRPGEEYA
jgi:hypothetical protein